MPDYGVILVFTDTGSHQLGLENVIKEKMEKKNVKIFFVFFYEDATWSQPDIEPSLEVYKRLSKGQMFYYDPAEDGTVDLDSEKFFKAVVHTVRNKL